MFFYKMFTCVLARWESKWYLFPSFFWSFLKMPQSPNTTLAPISQMPIPWQICTGSMMQYDKHGLYRQANKVSVFVSISYIISWIYPPPSNSGKWRFIVYRDSLLEMFHNPGGDWNPGWVDPKYHYFFLNYHWCGANNTPIVTSVCPVPQPVGFKQSHGTGSTTGEVFSPVGWSCRMSLWMWRMEGKGLHVNG